MKKLFNLLNLGLMAFMMAFVNSACSSSDDDDGGGNSASIVGEWTLEFSGSKGKGIQVLTFNSNGTGSWRELSNEGTGVYFWQYDDRFVYSYEDGILMITWGGHGDYDEDVEVEYLNVISLTSTQLTLQEWADNKSVTCYRMTEDMRERINSLLND